MTLDAKLAAFSAVCRSCRLPHTMLILGDVREKLRELPAGSVHCCVEKG